QMLKPKRPQAGMPHEYFTGGQEVEFFMKLGRNGESDHRIIVSRMVGTQNQALLAAFLKDAPDGGIEMHREMKFRQAPVGRPEHLADFDKSVSRSRRYKTNDGGFQGIGAAAQHKLIMIRRKRPKHRHQDGISTGLIQPKG